MTVLVVRARVRLLRALGVVGVHAFRDGDSATVTLSAKHLHARSLILKERERHSALHGVPLSQTSASGDSEDDLSPHDDKQSQRVVPASLLVAPEDNTRATPCSSNANAGTSLAVTGVSSTPDLHAGNPFRDWEHKLSISCVSLLALHSELCSHPKLGT